MMINVREVALAAAALTALGVSGAQADFPERTITLISPFNAGGGNDTVARLLASELEKELDTNFLFAFTALLLVWPWLSARWRRRGAAP